jgi:hypothetical protein
MRRSSEAATVILALGVLLTACNGTEEVPDDDTPLLDGGASEPRDYWLDAFEKYMTPEFKAEYVATPEEERLSRHRAALIDFLLRDQYLAESQVTLSQAQLETYRGLPDAAACKAYIEELERER